MTKSQRREHRIGNQVRKMIIMFNNNRQQCGIRTTVIQDASPEIMKEAKSRLWSSIFI